MISRADIVGRVQEWSLAEHVVEKDYILGWVLWGIGSDATLGERWVFKGGTCLKKCFIETYRFSEDLDFTVLPGGPLTPEEVLPLLRRVLQRVGEESGIDFTVGEPRLRVRPSGTAAEGRIYYRGPRNTPGATSVKLDLSADETVVRPTVLRTIAHPYPDTLPAPDTARCYAFEEVFAEKLRAMAQRGRPRDLYDIVNLFRRNDLGVPAAPIRETLVAKCEAKSIAVPTAETIASAPHRAELESEWANMLGHQLPALPPLDQFVGELPALFAWLHDEAQSPPLPAISIEPDEDETWTPPATVTTWEQSVPIEPIRFAGANHLCVEVTYDGAVECIQPYALRRTQAGRLVLHALCSDTGEHRSYPVEQIQRTRITTEPFRPVHAIELSPSEPLSEDPHPLR